MPFGKIIEKSFKFPWENKGLWFYGVLIAIFSGGSSISNQIDSETLEKYSINFDLSRYLPYLVVGGLILLALLILSMVLVSWSQAAIGQTVPEIENGKKLTRKEMGKTGKKVVLDLIKLNYLLPLALFLIASIIIALVVILPLSLLPQQTALIVGAVILGFGILALIPFLIYLGILWTLAARAVIIDKTRVFEGFKEARKNLKGFFWQTFLFAIIIGVISGAAAVFFIIPFILVIALAGGGMAAGIYPLLVIGLILGLAYLLFYLVVIGYLQSFAQTGWSLWWLELKKVKAEA